jgi:DNA-binding CsgD family transcriptional regulator/tetratricopeptide (TPR) repeat protein
MADDLRPEQQSRTGSLIVGRESEQAALLNLLDSLFEGVGCAVLISGEAGIGKTTLVRMLIAEAASRGALILSGACYEYELPAPYAIWKDALHRVTTDHSTDADLPDPPDLELAGGTDELHRMVFEYLMDLSSKRPMVLALEDLQWADESSLDLFQYLTRQPERAPVILVATCRDEDLNPDQPFYRLLPSFIRESRPYRYPLGPIDRTAIRTLIEQRHPTLTLGEREQLGDYLNQYGEGNPFFIEELLGMLEYQQVLVQRAGVWALGNLPAFPVPPLVRQVIDGRLVQVGPESMRLLEIGSIAGVEVPLDLWQAVSSATDEALALAIEEALQERVIEELPDASGYRFRHALIHGVVYERPNTFRRREWHRRAAEWLADRPAVDPSVVAHHFTQAGDSRAAQWLIQAGRQAGRSFALRSASANYQRALEILEHDDSRLPDRTWLLCALAEANRYTNIGEALAWINRAYDLLDRLDDPAMRVLALWCRARIRGFHHENVLEDLQRAAADFALLAVEDQDRIRQTSLGYVVSPAVTSQDMAGYGQFRLAIEYGEQFLTSRGAPESGSDFFEFGNAWMGLGLARAALGDADGAREAYATSIDCFLQIDNHQLASIAIYWALSTVSQVYDAEIPELRRQLREQEIQSNRNSELARSTPISEQISTSDTLILDGDWVACRRSATARAQVSASLIPSVRKLIHLDWLQGYPQRAVERIQAVMPHGPDDPPGKRIFVHRHEIQWIAAEIALDDGNLPLARRWIEAFSSWFEWSGKVSGRYQLELLWSRYHELSGDLESARRHAESALELASHPREALGVLAALRTLGRLELIAGNPGRAAPLLADALSIARDCEAPFEIASTLCVQAGMLHASGLDGDAAPAIEEAIEIARRLEARPLLVRLEELSTAVAQPAPEQVAVPFGLSPRELEVLTYVARGFTDARIAEQLKISPRTVGGHLQSILNKTGTNSRTAATAIAYQHGLLATTSQSPQA